MDMVSAEQYYGHQGAHLEWTIPEGAEEIGDGGYYMVSLDGYRLALKTASNHLNTVALPADTEQSFCVNAYDDRGFLCDTTGWSSVYMEDYVAPVAGDFGVTQLPNGDGFRFSFTGYSDNVSVDTFVICVNGEEDSWLSADELEADEKGVLSGDAYLCVDEPGKYSFSVVAMDSYGNTSASVPHDFTVTESDCPEDFCMLEGDANEGTYTATLSWEKSSDESGAVTYEVRLTSYDDDDEEVTQSFRTSSTRYVTPKLQAGYYDYVVVAIDKHGNYTEAYDCGSFEILDITAPETGDFTVVQVSGDFGLDVTWDAFYDNVGVCYYDIYVDGESWDSVSGDCPDDDGKFRTTLWLNEEYLGKTVTVGVRAVDEAGNEGPMSTQKYRIHNVECPENFGELSGSQKAGGYTAVLTWEKSSGGGGGITYDVVLTSYDDEGEEVIQTFHTSSTTFTTPALAVGEYEFEVTAVDKLGNCTESYDCDDFSIADITAVPAGDFAVTQLPNGDGFQFVFTGYSTTVGIDSFVISIDGEEDGWLTVDELEVDDNGQMRGEIVLSCTDPGSYSISVVALDENSNESGVVTHKLQVSEMDCPEYFSCLEAEVNDAKRTVALSWEKSIDASAITYEVVVSHEKDEETISQSYRTTNTHYTTPVLEAGNYEFMVIAYDKWGNYTESSDIGYFEIADTTAPETGSFTVVQVSGDYGLLVSWDAFKDNVGVGAYDLYLDGEFEESVGGDYTEEDGSYQTTLWLNEDYLGKSVTIGIRAVDDAGNESALTTRQYQLHEVDCPMAVENLELTQQGTANAVGVSWSASQDNVGVARYLVLVDDDWSSAVSVTECACRLEGLAFGAEHEISVIAVDVNGNESDSTCAGIFMEDVSAPEGGELAVVQEGNELVLTISGFRDNDMVSGYDIYLDDTLVSYADAVDEDGNPLSLQSVRLELSDDDMGTIRTVSVKALDANNNESDAIAEDVTIGNWSYDDDGQAVVEEVISGLSAVVSGDGAQISWSALSEDQEVVGYRVYVDTGLELSAWEREDEETGEMVSCWEHTGGYAAADTCFSVSGLCAGGHYAWVEAELADGRWIDSGYAVAFEIADIEAPKAGEFTATQSEYGYCIELAWTGFSDNFAIAGYSVKYQESEIELSADQSELSLWCFGEEDIGKTVVFTIQARDYAGNVGAEISKIVTIAEAKDAEDGIEINWDNPLIIGVPEYYYVYLEGEEEPIQVTDQRYHLCVQPNWTERNYLVVAMDADGKSLGNVASGKVVAKAEEEEEGEGGEVVPGAETVDTTAPTPGVVLWAQASDSCNVMVTWGSFGDNVAVTAYKIVADGEEHLLQASELTPDDTGKYHWLWELPAERAGETVTLTVQGMDAAGNVSLPVGVKPQLKDVTPPSAVTGLAYEQVQGQGVAVFTWNSASDNTGESGIAGYVVTIDGVEKRISGTSCTTDALNVGTHTISIFAEDQAGNKGAVVEQEFEIDDFTAPVKGCVSLLRGNGDYEVDVRVESYRDNVAVVGYNVYIDGVLSQTVSVEDAQSYQQSRDASTVCRIVKDMSPRAEGGCRIKVQFDITQTGRHTIGVSAIDSAGNESGIASRRVSIQDVTSPGTVENVRITGCETSCSAIVSWTAACDNSDGIERGSGIQYYLVSLDYGKWTRCKGTSMELTGLANGEHCVRVKAVDGAGNKGQESGVVRFVALDGVVETPDVTAPTAGRVSLEQAGDSCNVLVSWSGYEDETGVTAYKVVADGVEHELAASALEMDDTGVYHWVLELEPERTGDYMYITVQAMDAAGNTSDAASAGCRLADVFAPTAGTVAVTQSEDGESVLLAWSGFTDNVAVTAYNVTIMGTSFVLDATNLSADDAGVYHWLMPVDTKPSDGRVEVSLVAVDGAGNASDAVSASCQLVDVMPPEAVTGLAGKQLAHQSAYQFTWNAAVDNGDSGVSEYVVTIDDTDYVTSETSYTTGALALGAHTFSVVARDAAGNTGTDAAELRFCVTDYTAPAAGTIWVGRGDGDYGIVINARDFSDDVGVAGYKVYVDGQLLQLVSAADVVVSSGMGRFGVTLAPTHTGLRVIGVSAVDEAGNESTVASRNYLVADVTAPEKVTGLTATTTAGTREAVVSWDTATDNSDGAVPGSGIDHYLVSLDGGKWNSYTDTNVTFAKLSNGEHRVQVMAVDDAGNTSAASDSLAFIVGQGSRSAESLDSVALSSSRPWNALG